MTDMLVKLFALPEARPAPSTESGSVTLRRAMAYEKRQVAAWVASNFGEGWASECEVAFSNHPPSCYLATRSGRLLGFACYDSVCRGFFGPIGVLAGERGAGIGAGLLRHALEAMAQAGYGYAIIGGVGDTRFYERVAGATSIEGSTPGIYADRLMPGQAGSASGA